MLEYTENSDGTVSLYGQQGTNLVLNIEVYSDTAKTVPLDLSTYEARAQMRKKAKATSPVLIEFTCTIVPYHVTGNPDTNQLILSAAPADTEDLTTLTGVYDIEIYVGDATVTRIQEGTITLSPGVTRVVPVTP